MRTSDRRRQRPVGLALLACAVLSAPPVATGPVDESAARSTPTAQADAWLQARPDYAWSFPRDHRTHPGYRVEWWYFTGHLEASSPAGPGPRRFGYQFTVFRVGVLPSAPPHASDWSSANLLMGHAAITDKDNGAHVFAEVLYRERPGLAQLGTEPGQPIVRIQAAAGTDGAWRLDTAGEGFDFEMVDATERIALRLGATPLGPRVFQGPNGFSRKSDEAGAASHYYSYTRMGTRGRLTLDGVDYTVSGESWMDHEFSSSQLGARQVGWDWFSLQLADGREIMLYELRRTDGATDYGKATVVSAAGEPRYLDGDDFRIRSSGTWRSRETGIEYPSGWIVDLPGPGPRLVVRPDVAAQENVSQLPAGPSYWEGSVTVLDEDGAELGRGYVELTGYGEGNRPPV